MSNTERESQPTLAAAVAETRRALASAGIATAPMEARLLVARAAELAGTALLGRSQAALSAPAAARLAELVARRRAREPLAYIFGEKEFWSLTFAVDRSTLIPRPDSETLVEAALTFIAAKRRPMRVLDLGTGCGCLLLALLHAAPATIGVGVDISAAAVRIARSNAERLGLGRRAAFFCGDWADAVGGGFDIVLANPPYVSEAEWPTLAVEIRDGEPRRALVGGADGLAAYRQLLPAVARLLAPGGAAFFEIGCAQASAVAALATATGFQWIEFKKDLAGIERCLMVLAPAAVAKKSLGTQALPV